MIRLAVATILLDTYTPGCTLHLGTGDTPLVIFFLFIFALCLIPFIGEGRR